MLKMTEIFLVLTVMGFANEPIHTVYISNFGSPS